MGDARYTDDDIRRLGAVIAEDIKSEFRTGFEAIEEIKQQVAKIPVIEQKVDALTDDMKAVKAALKVTNQDLQTDHEDIQDLKQRTANLETTVYHA